MHDFLPLKLTKENSLLLKREKKKRGILGIWETIGPPLQMKDEVRELNG